MVVAQIASERLKPRAKRKTDALISLLSDPKTHTFVEASCWADDIKWKGDRHFDSWHYINRPLSLDGTPTKVDDTKENALWAMNRCIRTLKDPHAPRLEQARMLRFLIHIVGDVHQPMHCVNGFFSLQPDGDGGGNRYRITDADLKNLHAFWDSGAGLLIRTNRPLSRVGRHQTRAEAAQFTHLYPYRDLHEAQDATFLHWLDEGHSLCQNVCYTLPENTAPSATYVRQARTVMQKQIALGGYRLANLLNRIYARHRRR